MGGIRRSKPIFAASENDGIITHLTILRQDSRPARVQPNDGMSGSETTVVDTETYFNRGLQASDFDAPLTLAGRMNG